VPFVVALKKNDIQNLTLGTKFKSEGVECRLRDIDDGDEHQYT
jgi:hypothetical protein